jgi:hypothetical protein
MSRTTKRNPEGSGGSGAKTKPIPPARDKGV